MLYYRISEIQVSTKHKDEQKQTTERIITEIIGYLNRTKYKILS